MTIFIALLIDLLLGDPPNRWHPVAWMGSVIAAAKRRAPQLAGDRLRYGATLAALGALGAGLVAWTLDRSLPRNPAGEVARAGLLKLAFAWRGLTRAAGEIQEALETGDLPEARRMVGWHLVSRNTGQLDAGQVAGATIESIAENLGDSVVAPLQYYAIGGLPGVWAYRFVNTADAMIGYRDPAHAELGRFAAKLDDALNFVPSRLAAVFIAVGAALAGEDGPRAWRTARRVHVKTDSPNAGWPMGAMAGALGVSLEKVGQYELGEGPPPQPGDIGRTLRVARVAIVLAAGCMALLRWLLARQKNGPA
jgi:adenosylcobinamide-phosphate synthase